MPLRTDEATEIVALAEPNEDGTAAAQTVGHVETKNGFALAVAELYRDREGAAGRRVPIIALRDGRTGGFQFRGLTGG